TRDLSSFPTRRSSDLLLAVLVRKAQDAECGAVALLGMGLCTDHVLDERGGVRPDRPGPVDQPRRRPLEMRPVGGGAVFGDRAVGVLVKLLAWLATRLLLCSSSTVPRVARHHSVSPISVYGTL